MHATNQSFGISPMHTGTRIARVATFGFDPSSEGILVHPSNHPSDTTTDYSDTNTDCPVTTDICLYSSSKCHSTQRYFELCESATSLSLFWITGRQFLGLHPISFVWPRWRFKMSIYHVPSDSNKGFLLSGMGTFHCPCRRGQFCR